MQPQVTEALSKLGEQAESYFLREAITGEETIDAKLAALEGLSECDRRAATRAMLQVLKLFT